MVYRRCTKWKPCWEGRRSVQEETIKRRGDDIVRVVGIFNLPSGLQKNAGGGLNGHLKRAIYKCPLQLSLLP